MNVITPTTTPAAAPSQTLESLYAHALALQRADKMVEASQAYLTILQHAPQHWPSFYNLGLVFQSLNRMQDAAIAYQRVVAIKPDFAQAYNNMGIVLQNLKRDDEAVVAYERAITLDPALAQARYNMALIQRTRGQLTASLASLQAAVKADAKDNSAWDALCSALLVLRRQEEAMQIFLAWEIAIHQSPSLTAAGLAMSRHLGDDSKAHKYIKLAVEWPFANATTAELAPILGVLQYFDIDGKALLKCYQRYDIAVTKAYPIPVPKLSKRAHGSKLRIGYVSGDFRKHVMGRIMLDVISAHDKEQFSVHLISLCEPQHHDKTTDAFRAIADTFIDISKLTDMDAAKVIAEADLDVLVDLAGHTMAARPVIYQLRPATKIVTHLGHHGCLGMSAVDYKLTDAIADDELSTTCQIEKPFYLDSCLFPLIHVESTPEENAKYSRDETKRDQEFVFATFVNVLKMSPRCLAAWRQIVDAVPNAVLAFSPIYADDEASIQRAMQAAGIDRRRLRFIPAGATVGEQRARYQLIDAVLDTFPYAGGDTTLAALDRDVPVVTLRAMGGRNAERVGASILTHLGVADTVCENEAAYVACAIRIAQDKPWHASLRARIADARQHAPIAQVANHTKSLERAYIQIAAEGIQREESALSAEEFFREFNIAIKAHEAARDDISRERVAQRYAALDAEQPGYLPLQKLSAMLANTRGRTDEAVSILKRVLLVAPQETDSALTLAGIQSDAHDNENALATVDAALHASPYNVMLLTAKTRILLRLDRAEEALLAADLAVSASPADVPANLMRANALAELGRADLALQAYSRVLSQAPAHVDAAYNAALMSLEAGNPVVAESLFRRVINLDAKHELAHIKLAQALKAQGKIDAWISLAKRVAVEFTGSARSKLLRAETLRFEQDLAGETREMSALAKALCAEPDHFIVEELAQPILCRAAAINLAGNATEMLAARYLAALDASYQRGSHAALNWGVTKRAIKIGFLIEDAAPTGARWRAVNQFAQSFANDASALTFYTLTGMQDAAREDQHQDFIIVSVAGLSATRAAKRIRDDAPDVLIDLVGYRHPLAPPIMFQQPARMQLVKGAFANVFDCDAIDFEIFDDFTAPPKWKANGPTRPVMRLNNVSCDLAPIVKNDVRSDHEETAPKSAFIFAIGAAAAEISLASIRVWKSILDQFPQAMIAVPAIGDAQLRAYHDVLRAGGIGSTRIAQLRLNPDSANRFVNADAVLDTIGVSDAMVASEALAAGVAVIALRGPTAPERMAYSVLAQHGLAELVADSAPDYIAVAAKYAREAAFRADVRAKLQAHLSIVQEANGKNKTSANYQALMFALNEISKNA